MVPYRFYLAIMEQVSLKEAIELTGLREQERSGPLYKHLASVLKKLIQQDVLPAGSALPPERELAEMLDIGRVTVRSAYKILADQRLIETRHGSGRFIAERPARISQPLWKLTSFSQAILARGKQPEAKTLDIKIDYPSADEAQILQIERSAQIVRLHRLRLVDQMPLALEWAVVPRHYLGDELDNIRSLYKAFMAQGYEPVRAQQRFQAVALDTKNAQLLKTPPNAPALLIERVSYLATGEVVELTRTMYRGDAYDFVAELSIDEHHDR